MGLARGVLRAGALSLPREGASTCSTPGMSRAFGRARALGDALVVLLNSDASVRRLKGRSRPVQTERDRARVLLALDAVDAVVIFDEDEPSAALDRIRPDVWAKGADYAGTVLPERTWSAAGAGGSGSCRSCRGGRQQRSSRMRGSSP